MTLRDGAKFTATFRPSILNKRYLKVDRVTRKNPGVNRMEPTTEIALCSHLYQSGGIPGHDLANLLTSGKAKSVPTTRPETVGEETVYTPA